MSPNHQVRRVYDARTMSWSFPDGSGVLTEELILRERLLTLDAIINGEQGTRKLHNEIKEIDKWFVNKEFFQSV